MARLRIGTSGYVYRHWRGVFYPDDLPSRRWLPYYAQRFLTVELNAPFYRLPAPGTVDRWRESVPPGFLFSVKGSRFLTHMKRLLDAEQGLERFFGPILRLAPKLGPILWQLPPGMTRPDLPRLERFLAQLPRGPRYVFEFRAEGWHTEAVCELLDRHGAAICEHDLLSRPVPGPTGGFRYLRFHGRTGKYQGRYGRRALRPIAHELVQWRAGGHDAFVYFNNDLQGHALVDAMDLGALVNSEPEPLLLASP